MLRTRSVLLALLCAAAAAWGDTVLTEGFEQQGSWKKNIRGKGSIELADGGVEGKCLKVTSSENALAYYTLPLDAARVRGKRLIIRAQVKLDGVERGPEVYSTAKLHVGCRSGGTTEHRAQRFIGTRDWHPQVLVAPIPDDAENVVLDLGIQNGNGTAWFDSLVVDDGVKEHVAVSIVTAANASYGDATADDGRGGFIDTGPLDLRGLPVADVRLGGIDFSILPPEANYGRTCIVLRGGKRPRLPARIETVLPVRAKAARLFFLQAAMWHDPSRKAPCLRYSIHYADGKSADLPMHEGTDIGAFDAPRDLANWKVAWTAKQEGRTLGLGVATWVNPRPGVPIEFIRLSTLGTGAVPIVVAISLDPKTP